MMTHYSREMVHATIENRLREAARPLPRVDRPGRPPLRLRRRLRSEA